MKDLLSIQELRNLLKKPAEEESTREKPSDEKLAEIDSVRDSLLNSAPPQALSKELTNAIQKLEIQKSIMKLGMQAQEAIEDPFINIIDNHVEEIIQADERICDGIEDIMEITRGNMLHSDQHNIYRENLKIKAIYEEVKEEFIYSQLHLCEIIFEKL